jgi:ligand-binding SRPBCC domain-containing protein
VPQLRLVTEIQASADACFALSLDVDVHRQSTGGDEEVVAGVMTGEMALGDSVTWRARHFGVPWRMTSKITAYDRPRRFVDEQQSGPFAAWHHEHRFAEQDGVTTMTDLVDYRSPAGPIGALVDRIALERYMTDLLGRRNSFLKSAAESRGTPTPS